MIPTTGPRRRVWQWWTWWAHTCWFQFAHKPLCTRFSREVLRIGTWRVCRSCALLYFAAAATAVVLLTVRPPADVLLLLCLGLGGPMIAVSYPPLYDSLGRHVRDTIRLATGIFASLWLGLLFCGHLLVPAATGPVLVVLYLFYKRTRASRKTRLCAGCPELETAGVCPGYAQQAESIRAYSERVEDVLNGDGPVPLVVRRLAGALNALSSRGRHDRIDMEADKELRPLRGPKSRSVVERVAPVLEPVGRSPGRLR